jgi:hypothetical protein
LAIVLSQGRSEAAGMAKCFVVMPISMLDIYADRYNDLEHFEHVLDYLFIPALEAAGYEAVSPAITGSDLIQAENRDGGLIYAALKRYPGPVPGQTVRSIKSKSSATSVPVLLITYTELTNSAQASVNTAGNLVAVQWRDKNDNDRLGETLRHMFASISSNPPTTTDD